MLDDGLPHSIPTRREEKVDECQPPDGDTEEEMDAADYLDFLSSAFMSRIYSGEKVKRCDFLRKRGFEDALERRRQKQSRIDDFFEIYR